MCTCQAILGPPFTGYLSTAAMYLQVRKGVVQRGAQEGFHSHFWVDLYQVS